MEALTAALEANTAIQTKVLAALQKAGGGAAASAGAAAGASKPAAAAAGKPAGGKPAGGKKKTTVEDIAAAFGGYLGIKDKDEREVRKGNVKAIVDYFGVAKATELDPSNYDEALKYLQQYIDGEEPEFSGGGEDEGEEDEGALV
jgi:hypothetical protein